MAKAAKTQDSVDQDVEDQVVDSEVDASDEVEETDEAEPKTRRAKGGSQQGKPRHPEDADTPAADLEVHPDTHNPKINPNTASNAIKDPDEWASGDEPMTGAQASYLKTLSEEAKEPDAFSEDLSKAEASKHIDAMRAKLHRG